MAIHFILLSYWGELELGILSLYIGSLGFFFLLIADQMPPSFSPWLFLFTWKISLWVFALNLSRCAISFARSASSVWSISLCSKLLVAVMFLLSFYSVLILVFIL